MKRDGHVHTPFCPHGTKDRFEDYIEKALALGLEEISFTEHAPLPRGFSDTTPLKDSAMSWSDLSLYFNELDRVKRIYKDKIKINTGLEIDFIEGFETEIKQNLNHFGPRLDDAILSVHFLKNENQYDCLDYSPQVFGEMVESYGSVEAVYQKYYETVNLSIHADLGIYKPKRIGHITLVHKFQKSYPFNGDEKKILTPLLISIKEKNYSLDYNGAGTAKPLCREPYPPHWVIEEASKLRIPLIYGSDAHQVKELKQGYDQLLI